MDVEGGHLDALLRQSLSPLINTSGGLSGLGAATTMSKADLKIVVLVSGEVGESSLFLDTLKARESATYICQDTTQISDIRKYTQHGQVDVVESYLERRRDDNFDSILILGSKNVAQVSESAFVPVVDALYRDEVDIIAIGTGRMILAASGLLKECLASSASLQLDDHSLGLAKSWQDAKIVRDGTIWTAEDNATTVCSLAFLYKAARKGNIIAEFPAYVFENYRRGETAPAKLEESTVATPSTSPGVELARQIASTSRADAKTLLDPVANFAVRLGLEGHVTACNAVISSLLSVFPNMYSELGTPSVMPLEFIWERAGQRPAVPWEVALEDLNEWDRLIRENYHLPCAEEREDILESLKARVFLGRDWSLYPYSLAGAIVMSLDAGWTDEARCWMGKLVKTALTLDALWTLELGRCRTLVDFSVSGVVAEITGHGASDAEQDAAAIQQALQAFSETSVEAEEQQRSNAARFSAAAAWPALVKMLDALKLEDDESALRSPASPSAIRAAEERLGVELPADYKDFLLITNGLEMLSIDAPALKPVEELCWESPEELGLDWMRVNLGCEVDTSEEERLPAMKRVLLLSDGGEESMWYIEPDIVGQAAQILKAMGRPEEVASLSSWRIVFYIPWVPEISWYNNFRQYVEFLAQESEKAGAMLAA